MWKKIALAILQFLQPSSAPKSHSDDADSPAAGLQLTARPTRALTGTPRASLYANKRGWRGRGP